MALSEEQKAQRSEYLERCLDITECSQRKPYVFISYASDDWQTVFQSAVVPMQRQYGLRVYADKAFDKVNDKWIVPMLRNLRGSDAMIAFVSQRYIESYACFLELLTAVNNKKQIVFVSLGDQLTLGDTTDLPNVERGVKNEILNQGANIATNTNNTSNDLMRAMKSAYTSLSTLLEQDALSKYDISDAFINFFRDASINKKTINDLNAVRRTIKSISREVFDPQLIAPATEKAAVRPAAAVQPGPAAAPQSAAPVQPAAQPAAPVQPAAPAQPAAAAAAVQPVKEPAYAGAGASAPAAQPAPARPEAAQPAPNTAAQAAGVYIENPAKKPLDKRILIGAGAAVVVMVLVLLLLFGGGAKTVTDQEYTTPYEVSGLYTGEWKGGEPNGQGTFTTEKSSVIEGVWADGLNGTGTVTSADGEVYEGEIRDGKPNGTGSLTRANGDVYEGEWKDGRVNGTATCTCANGDVYEGEWKDSKRNGTGIKTDADGTIQDGEWSNGSFVRGTKTQASNGTVFEGSWDVGTGYFSSGKAIAENGKIYEGTWDVTTGKFANGTITYPDGRLYEGSMKDGYWEKGTLTQTNGDVLEGEWILENGDSHRFCKGTVTLADGTVYEGEWGLGSDGETNCFLSGRMALPDGDYRDGSWSPDGSSTPEFADFVEGTVRWTQSDGRIYEGGYSNGTANGPGQMTHTDGSVVTGVWADGQFVEEES